MNKNEEALLRRLDEANERIAGLVAQRAPLDGEHKRMVLACITQCLWHTDFFFKSDHERRMTVEAYEAITGKPMPAELHRHPGTEGH